MSTTTQLLPLTLTERNLSPEVIRVKASFEEYVDFAEQCEYNVEYINGEIISMSQASLPHESLVSRLNYLLVALLDSQDERYSVEISKSSSKLPATRYMTWARNWNCTSRFRLFSRCFS